tara:strand:+ start:183 stop:425 length:243 start_codon:yes stop_codon:yes gene_type:complete
MSETIILGERDWLEKNSTFLLTLFGMVGGCAGSMMVYFLKSRCSEIKLCWGCVNCVRQPLPVDMVEVSANPRVVRQDETV